MMATVDMADLKELISEGKFQEAIGTLRSMLKEHPDDAVAQSLAGITQDGLGQPDAARDAFAKAYDIVPSLHNLQNLAHCLARQGHGAQLLSLLQDAPEALRKTVSFDMLYMGMHEQFGALDQAVEWGVAALERTPQNAELRGEVARLMVASKDYEAAAHHLEILTAPEDAPISLFANLGMVYSRLDRDDDATAALEKAILREPGVAQHYTTLSKHLRKLRQHDATEAALIKALEMDPKAPDTYTTLGAFYQSRGRYLEAADCFRELTRLVPEDAKAHQQLGQTQQRMKRYDGAIEALEKALALDPEHALSFNSMGVLYKKIGKVPEAVESYRKAVAADPEMKEAHNNLANALRDANQIEESYQVINDTIARWPEYGEIHNTLGVVSQQTGDKAQAIASYRRAIELNPDLSKAIHNITSATKLTADDPLVEIIKERCADASLSDAEQLNYNFALGKVMADLKQYPQSYAALERGNRLRKEELGYHISRDQALFQNIKTFFSGPGLEVPSAVPVKTEKQPIFILGMSRSGTSLCEQIVSAHGEVYGCGELEFLNQALKSMPWQNQIAEQIDYQGLRKNYFEELDKLGFEEQIFTDKMPLNFRWVGWILKAFPEAKIVHMVRDPMAVCWSNFQRFFPAEGMAFTFDQEDMGTYYALYLDLMAFWRETFPGQFLDFVYEDLTLDQEGRSRSLCDFLGLSWEDQMLNFQDNKRAVKTASSAQVREKIYTGSSDQWRHFEDMLRPMHAKIEAGV